MKLSPAYVGIILCKNNEEFFLVKRSNSDWAEVQWNFPGGLIELGESIVDAAIREAREEIDVTIASADLRLTHVLDVQGGGTNNQTIYGFYFIAHEWTGEARNNEPSKISDAQWFSRKNLPDNTTEHALLALQAMQKSHTYLQSGWQ